jgi:predicted Zn-dependent peptidase
MYRKIVLDNGLRVVTERMPTLKSVTVGIWVNVGSRDEDSGEEGLSHFIEHMFFKGTRSRTATQISHEIDALGGEMNAFTSRETTTFYVKVLDEQLTPALTLLSDLFHHSRFDAKEVEKEKQVVLEEIKMVQDDPEDFVQEIHTGQTLTEHPLGRSILGNVSVIKQLNRVDLLRYIDAHYHPQQTVVTIAGHFDLKTLLPSLKSCFATWHQERWPQVKRWPPKVKGGLYVHRKRLEQAHLCLGLQGVSLGHKDRYAAHALNAALGGSVSSRLFQEIREKRGLAYSIYSYLSSFSDAGSMTVYAATRPQEAPRVVDLVRKEIRRLRTTGVDKQELERVKNQMKGSLMLSLESTHSRMSKLAKDEIYEGRHITLDEMMAEIDRVSVSQITRLARELFNLDGLSVTVLGPVTDRAFDSAMG